MELAAGYREAAVIGAAAELGVFELLAAGGASAETLAVRLGCDRRGMATLGNALVALGVLKGDAGGYRLTPELQPALDPQSPEAVLDLLRHHTHLMSRWAGLAEVVARGEPAPRAPRDESSQQAFLRAMDDGARKVAPALWEAVSLARRRRLLDVGGGSGRFTLEALARNPGLRATVVDRPESEAALRAFAAGQPGADRLDFVAADALADPLPPADAVLLSSVVHIYGPDGLARLAGNLARALEDGGVLVIRDFLFADSAHTTPAATALFAVNMLVNTEAGGCYTADELEALFTPAGFGGFRVIDVDGRSSALLAIRGDGGR